MVMILIRVSLSEMKAFIYVAFPNSVHPVLSSGALHVNGEPMEHEFTSLTHEVMSVMRC